MNADRLLALYEKVAEAPDAIARLRRFVLDLAVRGKLVPQDAGDEPALSLLATIVSERKERVEHREIKRGASLEPIEEAPFEAPAGWEWIPLGDTGNIFSGNSINATTREQLEKTDVGLPFIATKDVGYGLDVIDYDNGLLIPVSDGRFKTARAKSVLICAEGGSAGRKIGLSDREICFGNKLLANETWSVIVPEFVRFVYMSDFFYGEFVARMTGVIGGISIRNFLQLPFPLPPLAEQRRIVAKVEELMALLDRLEAARTAREATRDRLTAASLARLTSPDSDPAVFPANARFALATLPALTTRPDQIKPLRQTILNLAVRGKLVEQDPTDEPASELLKRIARKKAKHGKGRDWSKGMVAADGLAFEAPAGWAWTTVDRTAMRVTVGHVGPMKDKYVEEGVPFLRSQNVRANAFRYDGLTFITQEFHQKIIKSALAPGDVVVVRSGNVGTACVIPPELPVANCSDLVVIQSPEVVVPEYLCFYLNSLASVHVEAGAVGVALTHFNTKSVATMPFPLPPLAEQHRIVAKVDALMALCDRLEAALTTADTTRARLLEALLHEALAPAAEPVTEAAE